MIKKCISEDDQKMTLMLLNAHTPIRIFFRQFPRPQIPPPSKFTVQIPDSVDIEKIDSIQYEDLPLYGIIHSWSIFKKDDKELLFPFIEFPPRESYNVDEPKIEIAPSSVSKSMYYLYNCLHSRNGSKKVKHICTSGFKNLYVETYPNCPPRERTLLIDIIPAYVTNLTKVMDIEAITKVQSWIPDPMLYEYSLSQSQLESLSPAERPRSRPSRTKTKRSHGNIHNEICGVTTDVMKLVPMEKDNSLIESRKSDHDRIMKACDEIVQCCHPDHFSNNIWCMKSQAFVCPESGGALCLRHVDEICSSINDLITESNFPLNRWFPLCPIYYISKMYQRLENNNQTDVNPCFFQIQDHSNHRINIPFQCLLNHWFVRPGFTYEPYLLPHPCETYMTECPDCLFPQKCQQLVDSDKEQSINQNHTHFTFRCPNCAKTRCIRCKKLSIVCNCWRTKNDIITGKNEYVERNHAMRSLFSFDPEQLLFDPDINHVFAFLTEYIDKSIPGRMRFLATFSVRISLFLGEINTRLQKNLCLHCNKTQTQNGNHVSCSENHISCFWCAKLISNQNEHKCLASFETVNRFVYDLANLQYRGDLSKSSRFLCALLKIIFTLIYHREQQISLDINMEMLLQVFQLHCHFWCLSLTEFLALCWNKIEQSLQIYKLANPDPEF